MILGIASRHVHLFVLLFVAGAYAAEGDGVRVVLSGGATPYERVEFAIVEKRGTVVAEVVKTYAAEFGRDERVGLLPRDEYGTLLAALERLGLFTLQERTDPRARVTYEVIAQQGKRRHRFRVADPELLDDPRYSSLLARIQATVAEHAGAVRFHDRMLLPSESGRLRVVSTPRAVVWLDDVALQGWTPLKRLRVPVGKHRLRLVSEAGLTRDYEVKIEVGRTTSLVVDLK